MKNALEEFVGTIADQIRAKSAAEYCACPDCKDDVVTATLNKARPRYVSGGTIGAAVTRVNLSSDQVKAELSVLVLDAMKRVKANPRHGPEGFVRAGGGAT